MSKRFLQFLGGSTLLLIIGAGCTGEPSQDAIREQANDTSPIIIGWIGPLSGDADFLGKDALAAAELAVEEVNADGGVNGRMIELIAEDGQCSANVAFNAGNKLIAFDRVKFIVGGVCSGETTAIAPVAEKNKVVVFSGCSSASAITESGDYIFRSYPSDALQGKFSADYIYHTLEKRRVAVLAVQGEWGESIKSAFENHFKYLGGDVVASEAYAQDARDLRPMLTRIKESNAELLYFIGYTEASVAGLVQAKELGLTAPIFGTDAWENPKMQGETARQGVLYATPSFFAVAEDWVAKLTALGGTNTRCAPGVYNAVHLLAQTMRQVGADAEAVKNALFLVKEYRGVNGSVTLDEHGDITSVVYEVKTISK